MVYKSKKKIERDNQFKGVNKDYLYFLDRYGHFEFRDHFKAVRMSKGISIQKLHRMTGVTASSISKFERGKSDLRWGSLERLVSALDCFVMLIGNYMYYNEKEGKLKRNNSGWYPQKEEIGKVDADNDDFGN